MTKIDFSKSGDGLIPVIVQSESTKDILMQAYANEEALLKTFETGYAHYFSRSRQKLWKKGETSGNTQLIKKIFVDCDNDCIIYIVDQTGPACHTGNHTCFYRELKIEDI